MVANRVVFPRKILVFALLTLAAGCLGCTSATPAKFSCNDPNPCVSAFEFKGKCATAPLSGVPCVLPGAAVAGTCVSGVCAKPGCTEGACDDGNPCTVDTCNLASGQCEVAAVPQGTQCSKKVGLCGTLHGECKGPVCFYSGEPTAESCGDYDPCANVDCDDENACTVDSCNKIYGCQHAPFSPGEGCQLAPGVAGPCTIGKCDGDAHCIAAMTPGAACTPPEKLGPCEMGFCDNTGSCVPKLNVDAPCLVPGGSAPCSSGVCDASGSCIPKANVGLYCPLPGAWNPCVKGACNDKGSCEPVVKVGAECKPLDVLDPCVAGTCDASGSCVLKVAPGANCAPPGQTPNTCTAHLCNAIGQCEVVATPGAACSMPQPAKDQCLSSSGKCDDAGACVAKPATGYPCLYSGPPKACFHSVCGTQGDCLQVPSPGSPCAVAGAQDNPCVYGTCDASGECQTASLPVGTTCKASDKCTDWKCTAAATCEATTKPTGATCQPSDPCTDWKCSATGACEASTKPPGATCKDSSACTQWQCSATGVCEATLKVDGSTCISSGWAGTCTAGKCSATTVCYPGSWAQLANPCLSFSVDAAGKCQVTANVGKACNNASTEGGCKSNSGVCDAQGLCVAEVTVGASCKTGTCSTGKCDANANCAWVPKVGDSCEPAKADKSGCKTYSCGANGECEAHVNVGKPCGDTGYVCAPKLCTASGNCEAVNLPAGTTCTDGSPCHSAAGMCDGAGTCKGAVTPGADCAKAVAGGAFSCRKATCSDTGECIFTITPGAPCGGGCTKNGTCSSAGECIGEVALGASCFSRCGGVWSTCAADGRCHGSGPTTYEILPCHTLQCDETHAEVVLNTKPDGADCTHGCTVGGKCVAGLCVGAVVPSLCNDGNSCTLDSCCGHSASQPGIFFGTICDPFWPFEGVGCHHQPTGSSSPCTTKDGEDKAYCNNGVCTPIYGPDPKPPIYSCNSCQFGDYDCQASYCTDQGCENKWVGDTLYTDKSCKGDFVCRQHQCVIAKP